MFKLDKQFSTVFENLSIISIYTTIVYALHMHGFASIAPVIRTIHILVAKGKIVTSKIRTRSDCMKNN